MIAYLDCSSGISGDKFLGALIEVGLPVREIEVACAAVGLEVHIVTTRVDRGGISGTAVTVTSEDHTWRDWADIEPRIIDSSLAPRTRDGALRAFRLLADAEALVHGIDIADVHFHEIGAADTVADLVGVAVGLEALGIEALVCSPLAVGGGTVQTSHGTLPVPAPATAQLLRGVPSYAGCDTVELTTPTGAALVRAHAASFGPLPAMTPVATGRGAGARTIPDLPNIATLIVGEPIAEPAGLSRATVCILETSIDHISPEHAAHACERLLEAGALDVWQTPIVMKKGRAGLELTVVCSAEDEGRLAETLVFETGTLGVRVRRTERYEADRSHALRETPHGPVRFKRGAGDERPEHDDVARIARDTGLAYGEVMDDIAESRDSDGD